jgi:hypothetical protein
MPQPSGTSLTATAALALDLVEKGFAHRELPKVMTDSLQLSDIEFDEVMSFDKRDWRDIDFDLVERSADAVFWFAPEAFCYYLPGFLTAGLRANRTDTNAYDSLIGMLDRNSEPDYWDDFFRPRWILLSVEKIDAVSAWSRWLEEVDPVLAGGDVAQRVQDALTWLRWHREEATHAHPGPHDDQV